MTAQPVGTADRSLDPAECWALLARTSSARLVHDTPSTVSVIAVDRRGKRITVELGTTVCRRTDTLLEIGGLVFTSDARRSTERGVVAA
ncbi:hypothetical protein [Curtobacterium sp. KT1]|uniref:hypothetical protein n=1 Tax=Curtobacterium sp. KT1 TaxID=3372858 RepID=UPI0037C0D55A